MVAEATPEISQTRQCLVPPRRVVLEGRRNRLRILTIFMVTPSVVPSGRIGNGGHPNQALACLASATVKTMT